MATLQTTNINAAGSYLNVYDTYMSSGDASNRYRCYFGPGYYNGSTFSWNTSNAYYLKLTTGPSAAFTKTDGSNTNVFEVSNNGIGVGASSAASGRLYVSAGAYNDATTLGNFLRVANAYGRKDNGSTVTSTTYTHTGWVRLKLDSNVTDGTTSFVSGSNYYFAIYS